MIRTKQFTESGTGLLKSNRQTSSCDVCCFTYRLANQISEFFCYQTFATFYAVKFSQWFFFLLGLPVTWYKTTSGKVRDKGMGVVW